MFKLKKNISPKKIRSMVILFTLIIMLATLAVGYQAYVTSRDTVLTNIYGSNLDLARAFRDYSATKFPETKNEDVLNSLRSAWNSMDRSVQGGFLCVIDQKGTLTLHTSAPDREGVDVGGSAIHPTNQQTLKELVSTKMDYVGPYLSSAGENQIAAFAYAPALDSVISIHVPIEKIQEQINKTTLPWIIGLMVIGVFLLPLSNLLLHRIYAISQVNVKEKSRLLEEENIERQYAEKKLQLKEKENTLILNGMVEAVLTINEEGIVVSFNHAAEEIFGYSSREIIGKNVSMLMAEPEHSQHDQYLANYVATGNAKIIGVGRGVTAKRKNGKTFPIHLSVNELPADINGQRCFIGSCLDITQQKTSEEQLRRSQKMDALGKLTGGIAHDYNNMLGVIMGYAELLEMTEKDNTQVMQNVDEIMRAAKRGAALTRKFVAFSKGESDAPEATNLNQLLLDDKNMIEKTLTVRIELVYELDNALWEIYVDKNDLEDSILNMVINAMHAMPNGGRLQINSENVYLDRFEADSYNIAVGDYVVLSISDNGSGISDEVKDHVFDPFFTTKETKGSGLGLSQVYSFVKRSKGFIKVYSEPGQGTRLSLFFPRYEGEQKIKTKADADKKNLTGDENILIVDDEVALVNLARKILQANGYNVFTAENGKQALTVLENEKIDLLFSDVLMPEMDGYELVSIVDEKYPEVKSVLTSGFNHKVNKEKQENKRDNPLLQKPYNSKNLLLAIRNSLDK